MLNEAKSFWDAISGKVKQLIRSETQNTYKCERYEVTTAPNGTKIGVTLPMGGSELLLPYSKEVASATVGDPVMVVWWQSMSNAKVCYFADGFRGAGELPLTITNVELPHGYKRTVTLTPNSRHVVFGVGNTEGSRFLSYFTRAAITDAPTHTEIYTGGNNITVTVSGYTLVISNNTQGDITISFMTVYGLPPIVSSMEPV